MLRDEGFNYQMRQVVSEFKEEFNLGDLSGDEFFDTIWKDNELCTEFGKAVLTRCNEYSGIEVFK